MTRDKKPAGTHRHGALRWTLALVAFGLWSGSEAVAATVHVAGQDRPLSEANDAPGRPLPGHVYKFVFDQNTAYDASLGFNPGLHALSGLIAEYAAYGVDARHRSIVVVLGGHYADMALTDASYRRIHDGKRNPSLDEIKALERLGVVFTVPVKDVAALSMNAADIHPGVKIGPRASIVYLDLEAEGYVFSGTKSLTTE
jgi:intracellular sulfur oxidation DsrE/DsrF family protein